MSPHPFYIWDQAEFSLKPVNAGRNASAYSYTTLYMRQSVAGLTNICSAVGKACQAQCEKHGNRYLEVGPGGCIVASPDGSHTLSACSSSSKRSNAMRC